jgi:hypothetical protein
MAGKINIVLAVDVIAALSNRSLEGSLYMMDDGPLPGEHQGTSHLTTCCWPGWEITWTAHQVDLQTPVAIKSIRFKRLDPGGTATTEAADDAPVAQPSAANAPTPASTAANDPSASVGDAGIEGWTAPDEIPGDPSTRVWSGIVPACLIPGYHYRYEIVLEMAVGINSLLSIESPSLVVPLPGSCLPGEALPATSGE